MTKVIKLKIKDQSKGSPWFMTDELRVGRRLRFKSYRVGIEMTYKITGIMTRDWKLRKVLWAEQTTDKIKMLSQTGEAIDRGVMGLRQSVQWELLDD